ncbi:hypothetical protein PHLCEN_2v8357 [Hermanssonia centrifuga]|uniref:Uncharacterized protein n=1 Tax=Hermanssonia centrifuga TaxID=98765 RepID=A0A2R6NTW3_9APHY|nr:hypothetical protein PHLCEN_2v8357 [Hermanssonia centrifuga]
MFRKTDWQEAVDQFNKASLSVVTMRAYTEQMQPLVARLGKIMEVCNLAVIRPHRNWANGGHRSMV